MKRKAAVANAIIDSAVDYAIISLDAEGVITSWNAGAEHVLGWRASEALGQSCDMIFTPEDRATGAPQQEMREADEAGRAADGRWHMRQDGSRFFATGELMPLRQEEGGYLKILRDRTEQRCAELALEESRQATSGANAMLAELTESLPDPFYAVDAEWRFTYVNRKAGELWNRAPQDLIGMVYWDEFPQAVGSEPYHAQQRSMRERRPIRLEARSPILHKWVDIDIHPVATGGLAVYFKDISQRKAAEIALKERNDTLAERVEERTRERDRVWRLSSDLMGVCRADGRLHTVNAAWTAMLGWTEEELLQGNFVELIHPDDRDAMRAEFARLEKGEAAAHFENRFRCRDGSYRLISWATASEAGLFYSIGRDKTERRKIEEQLRQSQKMEAVGQLTGGLAHDFNNLLTGISGSLEMMAIRIEQGRIGELEKYNAVAQAAAKRAAALTHRLLAFSRRQTLDPKHVDPNRLIKGMLDLIVRTVGPEVETRFVPGEALSTTLVDPNELENALLNLCINARDAMPSGGNLTIETSNRTLDERTARLHELEPGRYAVVCVSDSGTGMTPDVIAKAFDPFFTTKPIGVGTGLGLSMTYGFARQSGGNVRIHSQPEQGTTVCIYLPSHTGEAQIDEGDHELAEAPRAQIGETVLVVDDEPSVRMLVTDVLEELGYTAIEAADGAAGLKVLQSDARIDLLVSDVGLPGGMNGRQMADAARASRPDLKVLFITGYAETAAIGKEQLAPGMHVMTKPFGMEVLATRIRTLIEDA
ncbi:hybrid sensor histidine kinase/response regulator [Croceibacterium ferulae]|uniref:hybrid sensor histidine kinase/response regulator n=1 Tax=Croceibacterium ferulae TaxID=1854641 RepID=UPI000EAF6B1D|nr:PAS domain-containing sensor histidine kinase [Croceibacterium ferulae]